MKLNNILAITLKVLLVVCFLPAISRAADIEKYPKVLFFDAYDIAYLDDTVKMWGETTRVNGFFLSYVADWWTPKEISLSKSEALKKLNRDGKKYGIDSNFVKVALSWGSDCTGSLPVWTDDQSWSGIIDNFKNIASLIKISNTKGIAFDTEYYNVSLFNPDSNRFKSFDQAVLKRKIYQRGREIMLALTSVFPDIEVILLQEGAYWADRNEKEYLLWPDFYNGLASVHNNKGIIIGAESTYSITDNNELTIRYNTINATMLKYANEISFWNMKGSIAIGMWPLGKKYNDKSARYSGAQFREQFKTAASLSSRYVWIYGQGAAWWQMTPSELMKYTKDGRWIWGKEYQTLPVDPLLKEYYAITRERGL